MGKALKQYHKYIAIEKWRN